MPLKPPLLSTRLRALFLAGVFCAGLPLHTAVAQVRLPALGESAGDEFSISTERALGEQIMREVRRDPAYLDDPPLRDYMQRVWQPLVDAARQRGDISPDTARLLAWEVFLVRDRSINAFALPGGFVGVHLGLIAATGSSDELAAVLAHELTHVTQRHIARGIVNSQRTTLLSLAGLILGVLAASRAGSSDGVQAAVVGSQAAAAQNQLNYSRDMEREADRVGFGVLTDAGYSAAGMSAMFEKLESANRLNDSGAFPYLRSHPLTVDRISEARARTALAAAPPPVDTLEHAVMGARARVLMDTSSDGLRRQRDRVAALDAQGAASAEERLAVWYGGALAMLLMGDTAGAEAAVNKALQQLRSPELPAVERAFRQLQAQVVLQRGDAAAALQLLGAPRLQPASRWTLLLRGQAALALWQQKPAEVARCASPAGCGDSMAGYKALRDSNGALQNWLSLQPNDALAWSLLAQGEEALEQRLRAMRAQAEARAVLGDLGGAIDRLRAAQSLVRSGEANDFIEASVIDARLRQLEAQRRELAAELRGR
jgi:predicted Zn-dependent protease